DAQDSGQPEIGNDGVAFRVDYHGKRLVKLAGVTRFAVECFRVRPFSLQVELHAGQWLKRRRVAAWRKSPQVHGTGVADEEIPRAVLCQRLGPVERRAELFAPLVD